MVAIGVTVGVFVAVGVNDGDGVTVAVGDDVAVFVGGKVGVEVGVHVRLGTCVGGTVAVFVGANVGGGAAWVMVGVAGGTTTTGLHMVKYSAISTMATTSAARMIRLRLRLFILLGVHPGFPFAGIIFNRRFQSVHIFLAQDGRKFRDVTE